MIIQPSVLTVCHVGWAILRSKCVPTSMLHTSVVNSNTSKSYTFLHCDVSVLPGQSVPFCTDCSLFQAIVRSFLQLNMVAGSSLIAGYAMLQH